MRIPISGALALSFLVGTVIGCSSDESSTPTSTTSPVAVASSTSSSTAPSTSTTTVRTITEVEFVPAPELASPGSITIDNTVFEFAFECYSEGAGDVLAIGVGTRDGKATTSQAIVQAFVGAPYVAVVDRDVVYELAIDRPAELFVQNSVVQGSALRFVEVEDVPGEGRPAGLGAVTINCQGFAFGYPEGFPVATEVP